MKNPFVLFLFIIATYSCKNEPQTAKEKSTTIPIEEVFTDYYEESLKLFPLSATYEGDNRYNDKLPIDISEEHRNIKRAFYKKYQKLLKNYNLDNLSEKQSISYSTLNWECEINLEELNYPTHLIPITQFYSFHLLIGQLAGGKGVQPFKTPKDYDNWLKRMDAFSVWCDTAIANMKKGISLGYVLPKPLTSKIIPQMESFAKGPVENHIFYNPVKNFPEDFSDDDKTRLTKAYHQKIENKIIPIFNKFHDFLSTEYLASSRETHGISEIPNGLEYYQHQIKTYTTTEMTPDEIFNLGQDEVKRITLEMEKVKNQVGFTRRS